MAIAKGRLGSSSKGIQNPEISWNCNGGEAKMVLFQSLFYSIKCVCTQSFHYRIYYDAVRL